MIATHTAKNVGSKAKIINFSGDYYVLYLTDDRDDIDTAICMNYSGGTVLPIEEIKKGMKEKGKKKYIILTTDTDLANAGEALEALPEILELDKPIDERSVIGCTIFVAGKSPDAIEGLATRFRKLGIETLPANPEVIRGKTLEITRKIYRQRPGQFAMMNLI